MLCPVVAAAREGIPTVPSDEDGTGLAHMRNMASRVTRLLGAGCLLTAGIGGYMAMRSAALVDSASTPAAAMSQTAPPAFSTPAAGSARGQAPASAAPTEPLERVAPEPRDRTVPTPAIPADPIPEGTWRTATASQTPA